MLCIKPNKNEKMVRDQKFLKTLLGKLDRGEIRRDFWLQRKSTQWNNQIRDQAIVTTVQGEDIDPVKICEEIREGKPSQKWIVDGGNRFETWNNFYNNVFALGKNLENYIVPYESTKKDENGNVVKDEDGYPIMEELEFDLRGKSYIMRRQLKNESEFNYCNCYTKNFKFHDSVGAYIEGRRVYFNIFIGERNYSIACKIAEEYLNKLINMGNGKVTKENIELMNKELRIAKK